MSSLPSRACARALLFAAVVSLGGCGSVMDLLSDRSDPPLEGERIPIMALDQRLEADPTLAETPVRLPPPYVNVAWTQPGGFADNALHHLALGDNPQPLWATRIGKEAGDHTHILAPPLVVGSRVFAMDAVGNVAAVDAASGEVLWRSLLVPEGEAEDVGFGGGLAYADGRVFVASGFGFVTALDADTGTEVWRHVIGVPLRSAPTVDGGRVFVTTHDNQLYALAAADGTVLWTFQGIVEPARILGNSSPAVAGEAVVAAFSSGELFALRVETGRQSWTDSLTRTGAMTALADLSDIAGRPVIDRGVVFAVSHSGRMVAIDLRTGERIWTRDIASVQTPWAAGDYIYLVTVDAEVVALSREDGRIKWTTALPAFENPEERQDAIEWSGPVLAGDRLILVSSHGEAVSLSPYTGEMLGVMKLPAGSFVPPVVAGETLYILTDEATLLAYR